MLSNLSAHFPSYLVLYMINGRKLYARYLNVITNIHMYALYTRLLCKQTVNVTSKIH